MATKFADNKGRVSLGLKFAGRMFIVNDDNPDQIIFTPALAIPEKEAWLYQNQQAFELVEKGLEEAKKHQFVVAPDFQADLELFEDEE